MRILVVSNLYPPKSEGGYELGCAEVVNALASRGHIIAVLTSGRSKDLNSEGELQSLVTVYRRLTSHNLTTPRCHRRLKWPQNVLHSMLVYRQMMDTVHPDVCYVWNLGGLNGSPVWWNLVHSIPICYFISDHTMAWRAAKEIQHVHWLSQWWPFVKTNKRFASHVQYVSHYLAQLSCNALPSESQYSVRHWGVARDHSFMQSRQFPDVQVSPLRLLFAARVVREKGPDIALQIVENLISTGLPSTLTIAGYTPDPSYVEDLGTYVLQHGIESYVHFLGQVKHPEVRHLMNTHDIYLAPFRWDEPFSIGIIEAMAAGLPVVATATGGTNEAIENRKSGMLFPPDDPAMGCQLIRELCASEQLWRSLRQNAEARVRSNFQLDSMVDKLERDLIHLVQHD